MGVNLGATPIADIKLGETQVDKLYLGDELVWGGSPAPTVRALKFTSDGAQTLGLSSDYYYGRNDWNYEYSNDGETWSKWNVRNTLSFGNGVDLYIRGINESFEDLNIGEKVCFSFSTSAPVYCSGNLMHLLDYTQDLTTFASGGASRMFANCTQLVTAPDLPATEVPNGGYSSMFAGCTSLIASPAIPVVNAGPSAFSNMFNSCSSLITASKIGAANATFGNMCCYYMFQGCTNLTTAPALPATTLGYSCYESMFSGCSSLNTIPALPATNLGSGCYAYMFVSCRQIKMSTTQTDEYANEFTFGADPSGKCNRMFRNTGGTFVGSPTQLTYYTTNEIIR